MNTGIFQAIRAVGSELGMRLWRPLLYIMIIIGIVLIALLLWLVSINAWWWLLALPISIILSVAAMALAVSFMLIRHVRPVLSADQKTNVQQFVDKLQLIQELAGTPKFVILLRTVRSIAAPRSESYLYDLISAKDLTRDFKSIAASFDD